jgi:hypothetical protein
MLYGCVRSLLPQTRRSEYAADLGKHQQFAAVLKRITDVIFATRRGLVGRSASPSCTNQFHWFAIRVANMVSFDVDEDSMKLVSYRISIAPEVWIPIRCNVRSGSL